MACRPRRLGTPDPKPGHHRPTHPDQTARPAPPRRRDPRGGPPRAFADDHLRAGRSRTDPSTWPGWHAHPGHDTYMVQTQGRLRLEFGPGSAESVKGSPGDLVLIPKGVVHPEANPGPDPNQAIAFRVGEGKILVNADVIQAFAGDIQAAVSYPEDEHYLVGESTVTHDQVVDQLQPPSASGEGA